MFAQFTQFSDRKLLFKVEWFGDFGLLKLLYLRQAFKKAISTIPFNGTVPY